MIAPHGSCKYAVVRNGRHYEIVAVHAIDASRGVLVSRQMQGPGDTHVWGSPYLLDTGAVFIAFCQTSEAAGKYRRMLIEQDREVEEANVR